MKKKYTENFQFRNVCLLLRLRNDGFSSDASSHDEYGGGRYTMDAGRYSGDAGQYTPRSTRSEFPLAARNSLTGMGRGVSPSPSEPQGFGRRPVDPLNRRAPSTDSFFGINGANLVRKILNKFDVIFINSLYWNLSVFYCFYFHKTRVINSYAVLQCTVHCKASGNYETGCITSLYPPPALKK